MIRRLHTLALVLLLLAAVTGAGLGFIDAFHPGNRIVSDGRVFHCSSFGGSWPVEIGEVVGLYEGFRLHRFGTVSSVGGTSLVVAQVLDDQGGQLGAGAWNAGDHIAEDHVGAVDDFARRVSGRHSDLTVARHRAEIRAARECSTRALP